jgi:hypothetical protein
LPCFPVLAVRQEMIAGAVCSALADLFRGCHITATQESPIRLNAVVGGVELRAPAQFRFRARECGR